MGRFSFRAGVDAENPDFEIVQPDRRDRVRRLTVHHDGSTTEEFVVVAGLTEETDE